MKSCAGCCAYDWMQSTSTMAFIPKNAPCFPADTERENDPTSGRSLRRREKLNLVIRLFLNYNSIADAALKISMRRRFAANMSGGIYISYRRDDASALARRLYDRLLEDFPQNKIFIDLDREDLVKATEKAIESSHVLIALIGKRWLSGDLLGQDDQLRLELATALKQNIRVMPVLVEEASMPQSSELPDDLKALAVLDTWQISDTNFDTNYHRLVAVIWGWLSSFLAEHGRMAEAIEAYRESAP
jgi:hypothetical protein